MPHAYTHCPPNRGKANGTGYREFSYNNQGLRTNVSNDYGIEQSIIYDIEDRPVEVTDANDVTVTSAYDALGRLLTRTYPDSGVEKFGYSARGLIAYTNQLSKVTWYAYDEAMRKTFETNANSEIIRYTNNAAGDLLSLTDGKSQTTKWNYDQYGRVTNKLDQASVEILRYKYDADGRLTNRWSKQFANTGYTYDDVGNLTYINYPSGTTDITYGYDALNRVTNMVDAVGTTKYTYTAGGQLYTEDGPWSNDTVTNTYVNRLRTKLSLQQPTGVWTNAFDYDTAGRLTDVTSPAGAFAYTLQAAGGASPLIKKLALPNSSYVTNLYDSMSRLTGTYLKNSGGTVLDSETYGYNAGSQRTQQVFNAGSTYNYKYDNIGQLKVADSATSSEDRGYAYDAAWNLNYQTNNTTPTTFSVDSKNQLSSVGSDSCSYDYNGNLTYEPWYYSYSVSLDYDAENQLKRVYTYYGVSEEDWWSIDFVYDGRGRLRQKTLSEWNYYYQEWSTVSVTRYVYDGMRVIQERNSGNTPTVSYTRGTDLSGSLEGAGGIGGLLARSHGYSSGNWSTHNYYHADGNGNVTYLVDSSQSLAAKYRYDPYGNMISSSGSLADNNVYCFSSKERVSYDDHDLYYYGYRFYEPNLQRWMNRDPLADESNNLFSPFRRMEGTGLVSLNTYEFADNSPVIQFDTDGRMLYPYPYPFPTIPQAGACALYWGMKAKWDAQKTGENWTRYAHCLASCLIAKNCGKATAIVAGYAKEVYDLIRCKITGEEDYCHSAFQHEDLEDNKRGRNCPASKSCEEQCGDLKGAEEPPGGPYSQ